MFVTELSSRVCTVTTQDTLEVLGSVILDLQ